MNQQPPQRPGPDNGFANRGPHRRFGGNKDNRAPVGLPLLARRHGIFGACRDSGLAHSPLYTEAWTALLKSSGAKCVPIPAQSPNCNPHAERFVKTIRNECLDHFVSFGERHLRYLIKQFIEHYLTERFHQGIGSQIIMLKTISSNDNAALGPIGCQSRLGRLLNFYHRKAA